MGGAVDTQAPGQIPEFKQVMGHPRPLWMLFMTEFWERFAFYGMRWALTLYIVAEFFQGDAAGERTASELYGAYLALVYAAAIFGGYVADKLIGYQRSILIGALIMGAGLFMISIPSQTMLKVGLATVIVGNGLFKPIISTLVGKIYASGDVRRDSGFTIFYMGINMGAFVAPLLTGWLAEKLLGESGMPAYKVVFIASGIGMLLSLLWFWFGRAQLKGVGMVAPEAAGIGRVLLVLVGAAIAVPCIYFLLTIDAAALQWLLLALFVVPAIMLLVEGIREGSIARDKVIAMLLIFGFNVLFWMFFEQAGSSFNFLADRIVNRDLWGWEFPVGWFQSVNSIAIITLAPLLAWIWVKMGSKNPSIPRKFGLGLIFNGLAFLLLMFALSSLVDAETLKIPFWTLFMVYVIQSVGELCLSPIGLSMTTKLAPSKLAGLAMGGWFLSVAIGNNLSGIFAGSVSGESGMTTDSALAGYTFGFWALLGAGVLLFLIAPLIQKLMHGVK
ncbi:peptide MFS transporter [Pseudoxanthomonas wuyuanensis]|uniref:Proton-dependent oligopeptide transporter, POT family n=1 Tax=Pseudoxanthomonas wuyuanensis TaxID=1073196 RepID=A0A286D6S6_9GAMM|nr:oligopeptide:H+ symporter [Pseudoxanthomonas wuyuanensis]KAF1718738.1 MFS transporter [Pseudoxanthomonas wuyuanensis]SOD54340.1 proton-dependent oligopeptide transporter, POT family [Pseudoxanthomonas wuyuanensis]